MDNTNLELYIQIRDGQPYEHPIFAENFKLAFPDVDTENLPLDRFAKFIRITQPNFTVFEVYEGVTYEWDGDVVKDVHHVRPMTDEERAAKTAELEVKAEQSKLDAIAHCNEMLLQETDAEAQRLWLECLTAYEEWELQSVAPTVPLFPLFPIKNVDGNWIAPVSN